MGIAHRAADFKRIVFVLLRFMLIFGFFLALAHGAQAQENPLFTVEGIAVDVTAENAVSAQQKAFEEAQGKAFAELSKRMVEGGEGQAVKTPDAVTISSMIKDFEVTNEQVSAVRYVGTYTFRFREGSVTKYFSNAGVSYSTQAIQPVLVLPYYQTGNRTMLWGDENLWFQAWGRVQLPQGRIPLEVPIGDLMDVAELKDSQGMNFDGSDLRKMLGRYGAGEAAIMIATPDQALAQIGLDTDKAMGSLQISIYRTDLGAPQYVKDVAVSADGGENRAQLYERAVLYAHQVLQSDWKKSVAGGSPAQAAALPENVTEAPKGFRVYVPFENLKEWVRLKRVLGNTDGMSGLSVITVSPKGALVNMNFRGDEFGLRRALGDIGMGLSTGKTGGGAAFTLQQGVRKEAESFYEPPVSASQSDPASDAPQSQNGIIREEIIDAPNADKPLDDQSTESDDMVHTF